MKKGLLSLLSFGLLLGIFGMTSNHRQPVEAEAINIPSGTSLYLKPNSDWLSAGARFAAYFFTDGGGNEWKDLAKESGVLDIYKVVSPTTSYAKVIFTRMNPATTENNWTNKWNQTGNLDFDGTKNLIVLPAGWDVGTNSNWSVYNPEDHPLPPSFAANLPIYFKSNGTFLSGATGMAAYYFVDGGSETQWESMTQVDVDIYKVITPELSGKEYDRVIFVSVNGTPSWDNKVNQTGNLICETDKYLYDKNDDAWKTFTERSSVTLTATTEGIDSSKARIWLDRAGHYEDGYTWAMKIGLTLYQPTGFEKALKLSEADRYFAYYDLPTSILTGSIGFSVVNAFLKVDVEIPAQTYTEGDNNSVWTINLSGETWSYSKGAISERIYNSFFAKVIEGYLSCSTSAINGYMAFGSIDTNFLPRVSNEWNMEGNLSGLLIKDFVSQADYASGTRESTAATDASLKYQMMQTLYIANGGMPSGQYSNNNTESLSVQLLVWIGITSITSLVGFYLLKKKRLSN